MTNERQEFEAHIRTRPFAIGDSEEHWQTWQAALRSAHDCPQKDSLTVGEPPAASMTAACASRLPEGGSVLFDPARLPPPDEMGYYFHPDIPEDHDNDPADTEVIAANLRAKGWECCFQGGDEFVDPDTCEYDMRKWTPPMPSGDGWQLVAQYDTEDGPCAMFVRPARSTSEGSEPNVVPEFRERLRHLLNTASAENASNTPDFILADFLHRCLRAYNAAVVTRDEWYKRPGPPESAPAAGSDEAPPVVAGTEGEK
jgi:hypothetical protein